MKIKKKLTESKEIKKLVEADGDDGELEAEGGLDNVDIQSDSTEEVADAIQQETDGKVSDEEAEQMADELKDVADEVGTDKVAIEADTILAKNRIVAVLDEALQEAKDNMENGEGDNSSNVCIEGLPGSGKTSIIKAWARARGIHLVRVNCTDPKLETAVNGMWLRDANNPDRIKQIRSDLLADLINPDYKGRCVLFVDEFNRQTNMGFRRVFLSLFADKENADGSLQLGDNLLFSIIAINPFVPSFHDTGVTRLIGAEKSRFLHHIKGYDSNEDDALNYFLTKRTKKLLELGVAVPDSEVAEKIGKSGPLKELTDADMKKIERQLKICDIATFIIQHDDFKFDGRNEEKRIYDTDQVALNSRMLDDMIVACGGDKNRILNYLNSSSNFLDTTTDMLIRVVNDYFLDLPALLEEVGINKPANNGNGDNSTDAGTADNTQADATNPDAEEDDFFVQQGNTGKVSASPSEAADRINSAFDNF